MPMGRINEVFSPLVKRENFTIDTLINQRHSEAFGLDNSIDEAE